MILGIDEVGRGPWAGPLVVGAVVLGGEKIDGLTDSKKLSKKRREELDLIIREKAAGFGLGWVSANEIDKIGLSEALKLATRLAVQQVEASYNEIIIDGTVNFLANTNKGQYVTTMKKADLLIPSVSAASIIAKVARDNFMVEQDTVYPGYNFKKHAGYGTLEHRQAIEKLGVTPLHRLSFAPLAKYNLRLNPDLAYSSVSKHSQSSQLLRSRFEQKPEREQNSATVTTKQIGNLAETEAANYLVHRGHKIIERNWKTKYCEIDIISKKENILYFTEVKYRKKSDFGDGLAAITDKKLKQMKFSARFYVQYKKISNIDQRLTAISLKGQPPKVEEYLEI